MKIEGFALIDKDGQYLYMEHAGSDDVGSNNINVYFTSSPIQAHLFESKSKAEHEARSMVTGNGSLNYALYCEEPVATVKLIIDINEVVVQKLEG